MSWNNNQSNAPSTWPIKPPVATPWPQSSAPNPWDKMTQDELLVRHQELKSKLEKAKEAEMELRKYIVARAFPDAKEGTNTLDLGNGYKLKAGVKFNYKLDPDPDKVQAALDRIAKMGNEGSFIADRLVTWSADFKLTEYRKLEAEDATEQQKAMKKEIDSVLTITDAAPTLEIKEPKEKK